MNLRKFEIFSVVLILSLIQLNSALIPVKIESEEKYIQFLGLSELSIVYFGSDESQISIFTKAAENRNRLQYGIVHNPKLIRQLDKTKEIA